MSSRRGIAACAALVLLAALAAGGCTYKGPRSASPGPDAALVDTYWKVLKIGDADVTAGDDAREAHLLLRSDHRATGFGLCNAFSGTWQEEDGVLAVGPLAATKMACADLPLEHQLFGALDGKSVWTISGDTLTLAAADGTEVVFGARYAR